MKLAVIENEFGEVGIDNELVATEALRYDEQNTAKDMFCTVNGCLCCTVREDLELVLNRLAARKKEGLELDGIIIETTGMADPAPVAQTFFANRSIEEFFRLDGIVTLVDAKHIEQHLDEEKPAGAENESVEQVAFADRMLLNKTDLVSETDLERVEKRLRAINAVAPIIRCCQSEVSTDNVLNIKGFDLKRTLEMDPEFLNVENEHVHDSTVSSVCIVQKGYVDLESVQSWVNSLLGTRGIDIYRMKGVLSIFHAKKRFVYQGVHMIFNGIFDEVWGDDEERESKLVFIGKNLDEYALRSGFLKCITSPEIEGEKKKQLRFGVGDCVECATSLCRTEAWEPAGKEPGWDKGKAVALIQREEVMPNGVSAAYKVQLDKGGLIFARADTEE